MACRDVTPSEEEANNRGVRYLEQQKPGSEWTATVRLMLFKHAILTAYRLGVFPPPTSTVVAGSEDSDMQIVSAQSLSAVVTHLFETEESMKLDVANAERISKVLETLVPGARVLQNADELTPRSSKADAYNALRGTISAPTFHADRFLRSARLWFLNGTDLEEWRVSERGGKATLDRSPRIRDVISFDE